MRYSDFTLELIEEKLGVKNTIASIFSPITAIQPSNRLNDSLQMARELPIRSEKAKSEWIVVPILGEMREINDKYFTIYSGDILNVDIPKGLRGECDFILAKDVKSYSINYPILQIVEAKKNDIDLGLPQCAAQMIGAKLFNQKKGVLLETIYGCVTTGDEWLFLKLTDLIEINTQKFYLNELPILLGAFQQIIDYYKVILK